MVKIEVTIQQNTNDNERYTQVLLNKTEYHAKCAQMQRPASHMGTQANAKYIYRLSSSNTVFYGNELDGK